MKFLTISLSAAATALLSTTATLAAFGSPANVYFFSHGRSSSLLEDTTSQGCHAPQLDLKETRATLAHLLNLGPLYKSHEEEQENLFVDVHGPIQQVFKQPGMARNNLFENIGGNLVVVVEGVDSAEDLLPSFKPAFIVEPSEGIQNVIADLSSTVPVGDLHVFNTHKASKSGDALVNEHLVAEHHANVDATVFDLGKKADALFLEESVSLGNYIEQYKKTRDSNNNNNNNNDNDSDFVRITIKGLAVLAAEHGINSVQYTSGQQILKDFLKDTLLPEFEKIHKTFTTTIITLTPLASSSSVDEDPANVLLAAHKSHRMNKRALPSSGGGAHCFATAVDCQTSTNGCSQHGACVLSQAANCFYCKCAKINRTQYGGKSCEKIDVSVEFHLFFWLTVVLVSTVFVAVTLILKMGSQSEGGVPVGPTRAQLKREEKKKKKKR